MVSAKQILNKKEANKRLWTAEMPKVANAWIDSIKKNPIDFMGVKVSSVDQLIAFEIADNLGFSDIEYQIMSTDVDYDLLFKGYKEVIAELLK